MVESCAMARIIIIITFIPFRRSEVTQKQERATHTMNFEESLLLALDAWMTIANCQIRAAVS